MPIHVQFILTYTVDEEKLKNSKFNLLYCCQEIETFLHRVIVQSCFQGHEEFHKLEIFLFDIQFLYFSLKPSICSMSTEHTFTVRPSTKRLKFWCQSSLKPFLDWVSWINWTGVFCQIIPPSTTSLYIFLHSVINTTWCHRVCRCINNSFSNMLWTYF